MLARFEGEEGTDGWRNRRDCFLLQELVIGILGNANIARHLANEAKPRELQPGDILYKRGRHADFIFFVFSGSITLLDDDNKVIAVIKPGQSLGESPLGDPARKYSVTAVAGEQSIIAQVSYSHFEGIAENKEVWKRLFVKVTKRLNERRDEDAARERIIFLVHGILTFALWQSELIATLREDGLNKVEATNFGLLDLITFLLPGTYFRRKRIDKVLTQLRLALKANRNAKISILAHSFGTYIVAEILASQPDITVHRLVLCGSIVPFDHPFVGLIGHRVIERVVNDIGSRDVWPALAMSATTGYGDTGTYGFRCHGVIDRSFKDFKHSDFFTSPDFCKKYWAPFFKEGENGLVLSDPKESLPLPEKGRRRGTGVGWVYWLSVFKLKVFVPSLAVLGTLIWWKWNYLTQLLSRFFAFAP